MTVKHFGKTLVGLLTLVVLLSLFCFNPTGVNAAKSTYRFESELVRVSSETNSFVQDDISSMDSLIVSSKTSQNQHKNNKSKSDNATGGWYCSI